MKSEVLEGTWSENKLEGHGRVINSNGNVYVGGLAGSSFSGYGVLKFGQSGEYEGGWKDGKFHGKGKLTSEVDDTVYTGTFENGLKHGMFEVQSLASNQIENIEFINDQPADGTRGGGHDLNKN
jgi:hypothetical protein